MMDLKNDLYKTEWLELVFAGRNKTYGAYELRQHNAFTTLKALITGSAIIIIGVAGPLIYSKLIIQHKIVSPSPNENVYTIIEYTAPPKAEKSPVAPEKVLNQQIKKIPTQKFIPMKVVPSTQVVDEMPALKDLEGIVIGQETIIADPAEGVSNTIEAEFPGKGEGAIHNPTGDETVGLELLEKYPEFPGGQAAFNKYISRNLRYPMVARENDISGRVFVSFIIEKNGSLSNIRILRGIGGGCDEEAMRVLKNSPSWSSGMQNGQKVRVAYTMPIFFQLAE